MCPMNVPGSLTVHTVFILVLFVLPVGIAGAVSVPDVTDIVPDAAVNTSDRVSINITGSDFANGAHVLVVPYTASPLHKGSITDGAGNVPFLNGPQAVFLSGTEAYIASQWSNALEIVDVSDPAHPVHKGSLHNGTGGALLNGPRSVYISGPYAYVASSGNQALEIVDVSDPENPVHEGCITNGTGAAILYDPRSVFVQDRYAYVTGYGSNSLEIVDVTDPANLVHAGFLQSDSLLKKPTCVFVTGSYAYITSSGNNALEIVDVSDPSHPVHKGSLKSGSGNAPFLKNPKSVYVQGNFAYIASAGDNALEIVDVTDPAAPTHTFFIMNGAGGAWLGSPSGVYVSDHYAYVASTGGNALEIVDVSNPAVPIHLGAMINGAGGALLESPSAVYVAGPYAYVTGSTGNSLEIADTGSVRSVPAESGSVLSGSSLNAVFNLTAVTAGEYSIVVTNPGGTPGRFAGNFTVTAPLPPPQVIGISPYEGFNTTVVRVTNLEGSSFNTTVAPVVKLNRTGFADIVATNVTVIRSTQLACTLDLSGRETGRWNVVVINPDGQEGVLLEGFAIHSYVPTIIPTTVSTTVPTPVPTTIPTTVFTPVPTTVPIITPSPVPSQESTTLHEEGGSSDRGMSAIATSPGAPAGGTLSFVFDSTRNTDNTGLPYAVTEVSLVPSRALGQTDLIVSDASLAARSPGDGRVTAGIVAVKTVATNPSSISSVTITFAVADDWLRENALTPDRVVLMHQESGIWFELPTTYLHHSKDSHFFAATTRGLSFFAISTRSTGEPATVTADPDSDNAPTEASVPDSSFGSLPAYADDPGAHPFAEHPVKTLAPVGYESKKIPRSSGGAMHWAVIPAFVIGTVMCGMCVRRWWLRRQNPSLFRKYD